MAIDIRTAQTDLENLLRDTILLALAKRMAPVASVADLRLVVTAGQSGSSMRNDDDLINVTGGSAYRWSSISTAADNGTTVVKPADGGPNGRWLAWTSPVRFSPSAGTDSAYLHELSGGPLARVIVIDKAMDDAEMQQLLLGQVPSVLIEATDDAPEDMNLDTGFRWWTDHHFEITSVAQNLRDRREAAQGSQVPNDSAYGANTIDGLVWALLAGVNLFPAEEGIRNVQVGRGHNWMSLLAERRVLRARQFTLQVTEILPAAPNDVVAASEVDVQADLAQPDAEGDAFDPLNYLVSGVLVAPNALPAVGLTQAVVAGSAVIAGLTVAYAGESRTFPAYSDTYRDLNPNGTLTFVPVSLEALAPPVTAGALRVGFTRTALNTVVSDTLLAATLAPYGPRYQVPL